MSDAARSTIRNLRLALDNATKEANEYMTEACKAADNALATQSIGARELFLRQEQLALTAYDNWRKAAENLRQRLEA